MKRLGAKASFRIHTKIHTYIYRDLKGTLSQVAGDPLSNTTLDTATIINILTSMYKGSAAASLAKSRIHEISRMVKSDAWKGAKTLESLNPKP
jgi:hypothetical protein